MIVSHSCRFVFIHIGKAGGDSIVYGLRRYLNPSKDVVVQNIGLNPNFHKHTRSLEAVVGFQELGWNWNKYLSFMVIRNPFELLHSDYWYHRYIGEGLKEPPKLGCENYDWFLKCWDTAKSVSFEEYCQLWYGHWDRSFVEQYGYDRLGKRLISRICRMERLDEDFKQVCSQVGLPEIKLERVNATQHVNAKGRPPLQADYTPKLIALVERIFKKDLDTFGYTLENAR